MGDWYDDDGFWEGFRDYMFSPARIESARTEVDQLVALLKLAPGARVLDLCCGIGRHSLEFARRGFAVTAVDRTEAYLEQARAGAANDRFNIEFVQSDMREFSRVDAFDGAICMFTSFGFFDDAADDQRVARHMCESLRPGAKFVIDVNGKEVVAGKFQERSWDRRADGTIVMEERRILDGWSRIAMDSSARHRAARIDTDDSSLFRSGDDRDVEGGRVRGGCHLWEPGWHSI